MEERFEFERPATLAERRLHEQNYQTKGQKLATLLVGIAIIGLMVTTLLAKILA